MHMLNNVVLFIVITGVLTMSSGSRVALYLIIYLTVISSGNTGILLIHIYATQII